jgi:hypothetical protein
VIVELDSGAFGIRLGNDTETILLVLDLLSSGKNLHVASFEPFASSRTCFSEGLRRNSKTTLCNATFEDPSSSGEEVGPAPRRAPYGLEAYDVLSLQALRALADFKLHSLALIQTTVSICLYGRVVYEYIFTGLALDESIALAGVEPLHSSLFLHFFGPSLSSMSCSPTLAFSS